MDISADPRYSRQIREVKDLLGPRQFKVLVPNFPPFAQVDGKKMSGRLVTLLERFASLVGKRAELEPLISWNYEGRIAAGRVMTVAAPVYVRPGQTVSVYRFCQLETCHCVVNTDVVRDFTGPLGRVHRSVGRMNELFYKYTEAPQSIGFAGRYKELNEQLRTEVGELLATCPKGAFAIPEGYDELFVVNDYEFPAAEVIPCHANDDVVPLIQKFADDGYVVLCNSVVLGHFFQAIPGESYLSKPLLRDGIPTQAGIPFKEKDRQVGELFLEFIRYGDPDVDRLLLECKSDGITILPPDQFKEERFTATGSLAWAARLSRCQNYSDVILESVAQEIDIGRRTKVLNGTVMRIDSLDQNAYAEVRLQDGETRRLRRIEVWRLAAAGLAYSGAEFRYVVEDIGSNRVVRLEPNEEANARNRDELDSLLNKFLHNEVHESTNEAKTPHSNA